MARVQLYIGGRNNNAICFRGNKAWLTVPLRKVIASYFTSWNSLRDITQYQQLKQELADAYGQRHFEGTDWEALEEFWEREMARLSVTLHGVSTDGRAGFRVETPASPAGTITAILKDYCDKSGLLREPHDLWKLDKLLRRAKVRIRSAPSFASALADFGRTAVSIEASLSFFRQLQAYHSPQQLDPALRELLAPALDSQHTLLSPLQLPALAEVLRSAGASLRVTPDTAEIVEHYARLAVIAGMQNDYASESVGSVLKDALKAQLYPFQREGVAFLVHNRRALLADDMGLGKAQAFFSKVLTPDGWKQIGDLAVGDAICNSSGGFSAVTGVFPQGEQEIFELTFSDGATTTSTADHLWSVRSAVHKYRGSAFSNRPLCDLVKQGFHDKNGNARWFIPMVGAVSFPERPLPLDPYLLGLLLGDGGLKYSLVFSSNDSELVESVARLLPAGMSLTRVKLTCDYRLNYRKGVRNPLKTALAELRLAGLGSAEKFIPDNYLYNSISNRLALFQGLLDTDGYIDSTGYVLQFSTTSPMLASQVRFLAESFGGLARFSSKYPKGGKQAFTLTFSLPPGFEPFRLRRKLERFKPKSKYPPMRSLESCRSLGRFPALCISTTAEDQLYVTDHCVVTHNTIQAISGALYLLRQRKIERVLIVCPASLKYQWQSEIHRFTGERCEVIGGSAKERAAVYQAAASRASLLGEQQRPVFYAVNYELVQRDLDQLQQLGAQLLILDEAQRIKNFQTKTYQSILKFNSPYAFVLTGTPLENQLMELYTIMRFIDDRALGKNPLAFRDRYVLLDRFGGIRGYQNVPEVSRKLAGLVLRRTKQQTLSDLPPRIEKPLWLSLTDVQRKIYRELRGEARELLSDSAWDSAKTNNAMVLLQRLREVCDTPELIDPAQTDSQKLSELLAMLADEVGSLDRQAIIFTQWTRMGEILLRELRAAGYDPVFLHGGLEAKARSAVVEQFQSGAARIFISTDAGGVGLNLQNASLIVNYDLPFNPAKLEQRIGRAWRLGQTNTVVVVNLLCRATVEENLLRILEEKQALFDEVFGDISDPDQARPASGQQRSLRELLQELLAER